MRPAPPLKTTLGTAAALLIGASLAWASRYYSVGCLGRRVCSEWMLIGPLAADMNWRPEVLAYRWEEAIWRTAAPLAAAWLAVWIGRQWGRLPALPNGHCGNGGYDLAGLGATTVCLECGCPPTRHDADQSHRSFRQRP